MNRIEANRILDEMRADALTMSRLMLFAAAAGNAFSEIPDDCRLRLGLCRRQGDALSGVDINPDEPTVSPFLLWAVVRWLYDKHYRDVAAVVEREGGKRLAFWKEDEESYHSATVEEENGFVN